MALFEKREAYKEAAASGRKPYRLITDTNTEMVGEKASNAGVLLFSATVFLVAFAVLMVAGYTVAGQMNIPVLTLSLAAGALASMSLHIAQQWERVVVLRLGRFNRVSGPGMFCTIPIIEQNTMRVDGRVRVTTFGAEETLTADLVPMDVNAVLFWMVWDAKAACTEVGILPEPWSWPPRPPCATPLAVRALRKWPFAASSWTES